MRIYQEKEIDSCEECFYYGYSARYGYDCRNPKRPDNEKSAAKRKGDFPTWCPFLNTVKGEVEDAQTQMANAETQAP